MQEESRRWRGGPFAGRTLVLPFLYRDEKQVGAIGAGAETLFIRVSLKSRFSERLSPLSWIYAREPLYILHQACMKLDADFYAYFSRDQRCTSVAGHSPEWSILRSNKFSKEFF